MKLSKIVMTLSLVALLASGALAQKPQRVERTGDRAMRVALRECAAAMALMRSALPIYKGHRVKAMHHTRDAMQAIHQGLRNNGNQALAAVPTEDNAPLSRFSREQIARSNHLMVKAGQVLARAKDSLAKAPHDYGGNRAKAITAVTSAISEVKTALSMFNQPGRRP